jgi:hypothetical protein
MIIRFSKFFMAVVCISLILIACAPLNVLAGAGTSTPVPTPTDLAAATFPVPTFIPTPTLPTPSVSLSLTPGINQTPPRNLPEPDGVNPNVITLDNNNQLITLHPGETFLLKLGDEVYQWDIQIDNQAVISRVKNIAVIRGAQGVYEALQAGTALLTANGDPLCRQSKPACAMPSVHFALHVEVQP